MSFDQDAMFFFFRRESNEQMTYRDNHSAMDYIFVTQIWMVGVYFIYDVVMSNIDWDIAKYTSQALSLVHQ